MSFFTASIFLLRFVFLEKQMTGRKRAIFSSYWFTNSILFSHGGGRGSSTWTICCHLPRYMWGHDASPSCFIFASNPIESVISYTTLFFISSTQDGLGSFLVSIRPVQPQSSALSVFQDRACVYAFIYQFLAELLDQNAHACGVLINITKLLSMACDPFDNESQCLSP